jgi:hypothetical protein
LQRCKQINWFKSKTIFIAFSGMKKKIIILNVLLSMAVLFSTLFQSIHSYEHHSEKLLAKHCPHLSSKNKTELTHRHSVIEKCFTCHFSFSSFTSPDFFTFLFTKNSSVAFFPSFYSFQHSSFFKGSLFSLRAPPVV